MTTAPVNPPDRIEAAVLDAAAKEIEALARRVHGAVNATVILCPASAMTDISHDIETILGLAAKFGQPGRKIRVIGYTSDEDRAVALQQCQALGLNVCEVTQ